MHETAFIKKSKNIIKKLRNWKRRWGILFSKLGARNGLKLSVTNKNYQKTLCRNYSNAGGVFDPRALPSIVMIY